MHKRPESLPLGRESCRLPQFFPSISSVKTNLAPVAYLRVLLLSGYPVFLVSAYDIHHASQEDRIVIDTLISSALSKGATILLDSGNYESYWLRDQDWTPSQFHAILGSAQMQLACCFDNQVPPSAVNAAVSDIEAAVLRDQEVSSRASILPIVHAPIETLPEIALEVARRLCPVMLAVPERHLGEGMIKRTITVARLRTALDQLDYYCPLHLLGTGNPLSLLLYAAYGADSFDGLEWCQTAVDHTTGRLVHFQQWDFFRNQTPLGALVGLPYTQRVLVHNLAFYQAWMGEIVQASVAGNLNALARSHLPNEVLKAVEDGIERGT